MKPLLIFATEREAQPTRAMITKAQIPIEIVITGFGKGFDLEKVRRHIPHADLIINAGIAGCFDTAVPVGSCHTISRVSYLGDNASHYPDIILGDIGAHLFTSPVPVYETKRPSGLIDMEGYILANLAQEHAKPIQLIKIVSDHCTANSHQLIMARIDELAVTLSSALIPFLSAFEN